MIKMKQNGTNYASLLADELSGRRGPDWLNRAKEVHSGIGKKPIKITRRWRSNRPNTTLMFFTFEDGRRVRVTFENV